MGKLTKRQEYLNRIYCEGDEAGMQGLKEIDNPYPKNTEENCEWECGRSDGEYELICCEDK